MPMTLAGIPLMVPDAEAAAWVERNLRPEDIHEFYRMTWPERGQFHLAFRMGIEPSIRLNVLHWPVGASRWAVFRFLASANQLFKLRQAAYQGTNKFQTLPLVLNDETTSITTNMWMLPPRHVAQINGRNDLYMITLVDDRFFWWDRAASILVSGGITTWSQLYAAIGTGLGTTITPDTINANYLNPATDFTSLYQYLPTLLDAVAISCGQRVVRSLAGVVTTQNPLTALASQKTQYAVQRPVQGGGKFGFDVTSQEPLDLFGLVPADVNVSFPRSDSGTVNGAMTAYLVSLASLALPEFRAVPGYNGAKLLRGNTIAAWTGGASPTNNTQLQTLANQAATDFYRWQLGMLDIRYARVANWIPEGFHDIEWTWQRGECNTRVLRRAWNGYEGGDVLRVWGSSGAVNYAATPLTPSLGRTGTYTSDSLLKKMGNTGTYTSDSLLKKTGNTGTYTSDSYLSASGPSIINATGANNGSASSCPITWSPTTTVGNTLIVGLFVSGAVTVTTPSGWSVLNSVSFGGGSMYVFIRQNSSAQTSTTFNFSGTANNYTFLNFEIQGVAATSLDVSADNNGVNTAISTGTTGTTSNSNELGVIICASGSASPPSGWTNGYASIFNVALTVSINMCLVTKSGIGSGVTTSSAATQSTNNIFAAFIQTFHA